MLKTNVQAALFMVPIAYGIYSITFKVSVFLNLTIAIVRSIKILLPFYRMRIIGIGVATVFYALCWAAFSAWHIRNWELGNESLLGTYVYSPGQYQAVYHPGATWTDQFRNVALFIGFPYLLPSCIVVLCMTVQIWTILKQRPDRTANTQTQRQITITILMLTVLFFLCNTVYVVYPIYYGLVAYEIIPYYHPQYEKTVHMVAHVTGVLCPFINAALNPVILVMRGQALSGFLKRKLQRIGTSAYNNVTNISIVSIRNPTFRKTDSTRPVQLSARSLSEKPLSSPSEGSNYKGPTTKL